MQTRLFLRTGKFKILRLFCVYFMVHTKSKVTKTLVKSNPDRQPEGSGTGYWRIHQEMTKTGVWIGRYIKNSMSVWVHDDVLTRIDCPWRKLNSQVLIADQIMSKIAFCWCFKKDMNAFWFEKFHTKHFSVRSWSTAFWRQFRKGLITSYSAKWAFSLMKAEFFVICKLQF